MATVDTTVTERALQEAVAELLDMLAWLWCHVPNEGKRSTYYGNALRRAGLKRGVPDVLIFERWERDNAGGHGIAIELKTQLRKPTKEQQAWIEQLAARGWLCAVCHDLDSVCDLLRYVAPQNRRRLGP